MDYSASMELETPRVFLSHIKNQQILEEIKTGLEFEDCEFEISKENITSIPIPEKILEMMYQCNCAIIDVGSDVDHNLLLEIGAAFMLYDKKIILVADRMVKLPKRLQGLPISQYDGDSFNLVEGVKLQKALSKFK